MTLDLFGYCTDSMNGALKRLSMDEGVEINREAVCFWLEAVNLTAYDVTRDEEVIPCSGDWSAAIPIPQKDIGWVQRMDSRDAAGEEIYLSPMSLHVVVDQKAVFEPEEMGKKWVTLTGRDGQKIPLEFIFGAAAGKHRESEYFRLTEITDPAQFQGGTLTVCGVNISLDDLVPVTKS